MIEIFDGFVYIDEYSFKDFIFFRYNYGKFHHPDSYWMVLE